MNCDVCSFERNLLVEESNFLVVELQKKLKIEKRHVSLHFFLKKARFKLIEV